MSSKEVSVIETFRVGDDWFAQPEGKPTFKTKGATQAEAVGRLVVAKARRLGFLIRRIQV